MKEKELKLSETKQILVATYSMASEGLDIKTLTTLIFATPKTEIEQSFGRILREKNENGPLVVDIIDSHDPFKNQWKKRKAFYMKEKYKIIQTSNDVYVSNSNPANIWQTIYDPSCKKESSVSKSKKQTTICDSDADPFLQGKCFIKI